MTDMKQLLDSAAGPEPVVDDAELAADLDRGRRAVRRRRFAGVASGAVATALVVGVVWTVLPIRTTDGGQPAPADHATPTATPKVHQPQPDDRSVPPVPSSPVELVANTKAFPGRITCDLIPKGWAVRLLGDFGGWQQWELYDPNLRNPGQYRETSWRLVVRQSTLMDNGEGITADKYTEAWSRLWNMRVGGNEAVSTSTNLAKDPNGKRELFVRQGQSTRMVVVSNGAYNLAWDGATLIEFAASCHYTK
jgi:hypothetical protein